MRTAAFAAAAVVTAGIYLVLAAALGFAPSLIAIGMVAIAMAAGLGIVLTSAPPSRS